MVNLKNGTLIYYLNFYVSTSEEMFQILIRVYLVKNNEARNQLLN